jgi:hypothetical protein
MSFYFVEKLRIVDSYRGVRISLKRCYAKVYIRSERFDDPRTRLHHNISCINPLIIPIHANYLLDFEFSLVFVVICSHQVGFFHTSWASYLRPGSLATQLETSWLSPSNTLFVHILFLFPNRSVWVFSSILWSLAAKHPLILL